MKVFERIDEMLQYSKNDIKLLEYLLPKAVIDNELVVPRKNKFFFDECKDHYFVTFKQKEIIDKFSVSQSKVSERLRELCKFRALQKNESKYILGKLGLSHARIYSGFKKLLKI